MRLPERRPRVFVQSAGNVGRDQAENCDMPPLIATYDPNLATPAHLWVRDGNHRLGAYERLGWPSAWVLIWYNSEEEYNA